MDLPKPLLPPRQRTLKSLKCLFISPLIPEDRCHVVDCSQGSWVVLAKRLLPGNQRTLKPLECLFVSPLADEDRRHIVECRTKGGSICGYIGCVIFDWRNQVVTEGVGMLHDIFSEVIL